MKAEIMIDKIPVGVRFSEKVLNQCIERMIEPNVLISILKDSDVLSLKRGDEFGILSTDGQLLITGKIHAFNENILVVVQGMQFNTRLFALKAENKGVSLIAV